MDHGREADEKTTVFVFQVHLCQAGHDAGEAAGHGSRFTTMFEALAIDMLHAANVKRAAAILRISWDQAWHLMERAVWRGQAAKESAIPRQIGIDEKAIAKGHHYMTLVCDLEAATVEYVGDGRTEASLTNYFTAFRPEERAGIEGISLDMWPAYIGACREQVLSKTGKTISQVDLRRLLGIAPICIQCGRRVRS